MRVHYPCIRRTPNYFLFPDPNCDIIEVWDIGVADEDNLLWCILLAYLTSIPEGNSVEFKKRTRCFGSLSYKENIKRWIKEYNPFLHRKACFYDENLRNLLTLFKEEIEKNLEVSNTNSVINTHSAILDAASKLLSCTIFVMSKTIFQGFPQPPKLYGTVIMILYCESSDYFSFAMEKQLGDRKQKVALQNILSKINIAKSKSKEKSIINKICSLPDIKDNILTSLLKSDLYDIVPILLKSPYVTEKLMEAGFDTNPLRLDQFEKCALIYAILHNKPDLIYCVYNFSIKYCSRTDCSPLTFQCMILLKDILPYLRDNMKAETKIKNFVESRIRELENFNNFFFEILSIPSSIGREIYQRGLSFHSMNDAEFEAIQTQYVIIRIFEVHETFYCWKENNDKDSEIFFDEFCKHADYFYNLDFFCALKFFDNFFGLKERIKLDKKVFGKIEASFFLYIYCTKYFESIELNEKFFVPQAVSYQKRLSLISDIRNFIAILKDIKVTEDILLKALPEDCVHTLTDLHEIYDEFVILRLKHYLNAAMEVNTGDSKFILVIERVLQIIGESVKDVSLDFICVQRVLSVCLPQKFIQHIKKIRNKLSRLSPCDIPLRTSLENDQKLFSSIQEELKYLECLLKPIFLTQKYKVDQFILSHLVEAVDEAKNFKYSSNNAQTNLNAQATDSNETDDAMDISKLSSEYFSDISLQLKEKIDREDSKPSNQILNRSMAPKYKYLFENILNNFKSVLNERDFANMKHNINCIKEYLYAIDYFLQYIKSDRSVKFEDRQKIRDIKSRADSLVTKQNLKDMLNKDVIDKLEGIAKDYEILIENIFKNVTFKKFKEKDFVSIAKTRDILCGKYFLCEKDREIICQDVSCCHKDIYETKKTLHKYVNSKCNLTQNQFEREISKLNLTDKEKFEFVGECLNDPANALATLDSIPNYYAQLLSLMEQDEIEEIKYEQVAKNLNLTEASRNILIKLIPGKREKSLGNQLQYLRDKAKNLYCILEEKIEDIKELWNETVSGRKKDYILGKVVEIYLNDAHFQATIEVLLFDCMNILDRKDLKYLWRKTTNLFSGINLRNVLAHGNPLLESLGKLLDPSDLPTELVKRMILLITDIEIMDAILHIVNERKTNFSGFMKIMNDDDENEFTHLVHQIKNCKLWKDYALLIPENSRW